jgi:hypothetical protein
MAKRCKASFTAWTAGVPRVVTAGDLVDDGDPVIKGREHLFESVDAYVAARQPGAVLPPGPAEVEQATAAPGERRSVRPVAKPEPEPAKGDPGKSGAATVRRPGRSGPDRKGASS